jgi:ribosomal protein L22
MLSRDERRARAIARLRETLKDGAEYYLDDDYPHKLTHAIEMVLDSVESAANHDQGTDFDTGMVTQADEILYSLYGYLIGNLPDEWYEKETTT